MFVHLAHPVKEKDESKNDEKIVRKVPKCWKDLKSRFNEIAKAVYYISNLHDILKFDAKII